MKKSWDYLIYLKQFLRYFSSITAYILSISWQSGRMYTHLLWWELQNYNSLLKNHQQENVGSYQKKKNPPHPRAKKPQQDGRRDEITFRIKPHTHQRCSKDQTKPCAYHKALQRLIQTCLWVFECLLWRYRSAVACCWSRGSGCSRPGYGISPLGGAHHSPHYRAARTYTGLGKQTLGGHKQNLVHSRTQEKGAVTQQETGLDLPICVQESPAEVWVGSGPAESGALSVAVHAQTFWESRHYLHYLHQCLPSGQTTGREHSPAHQQKIGLKIYWAWLCPSEKDPVSPLSQSLLSGIFHEPLILIHQRADKMKTTITEN